MITEKDQTEREKFEAYCRANGIRTEVCLGNSEKYFFNDTEARWQDWQARAALDGGAVSQDEKAEARIRDEMLTDYARIYKYPTPAETVDAFNKYYEDFAAISALERMSHAELEKWFRDRGEDPDEVMQTHKSMIAGAIAAFRTPPQQRDDGAVSQSDIEQWLKLSADEKCDYCGGTGIFYANVGPICWCVNERRHKEF